MNAAIQTAGDIREAVARRTLSAREAVQAAIARLESVEPMVHAFLQVFRDESLAAADDLDRRLAAGEAPGPLAGVPIAVKDNICLSHGRTTCASRMLEHYESPFTATAIERLIDAGAIVIGKTNLDEFAMGSSTEHSAFQLTHNPWDTSRVPGGSSGGSAVAVAAGIVPIAIGSDTGGSIRQPASHCGIVGLKPTYGRVSRHGLVAFASSLDQIGPLSRSVRDAAIALSVISAIDRRDATSRDVPAADFADGIDVPIQRPRIALPRQTRHAETDPAVKAAIDRALMAATALGADVVEIDFPHADYGVAAYYIVAMAEASSNLARYDGIRYGRRARAEPGADVFELYCRSRSEGLGPEVQRRIMLGTFILSAGYYDAYYNTALKARRLIRDDYLHTFNAGIDAVLMPVAPGPAFRIGEKQSDPLALYLEDLYTVGVNLAGLPAITLPAHVETRDNCDLPVGVQLIARPWDEARLLRLARMFESTLALDARTPPL